jgi:hypothetical protein
VHRAASLRATGCRSQRAADTRCAAASLSFSFSAHEQVHFVQRTEELDVLVGLQAVPPAQGGTNAGVEAHMRRWCAALPGGKAGHAAEGTHVAAAAQPAA